ncbi:hypothetical protein PDESU_05655 [Pontiella desulfatans]|uniref:Yip1 domain-containing protein n=1 Tax=Pontiella desulfatans TaxID=2750659 RepID=A0A6C2UCB3_PONDE|nr:hypothetical protein [Pontiella desulfatans]VGO17061.1 hypothetical protein PDESU_05655 [Pontiella desulfatans]
MKAHPPELNPFDAHFQPLEKQGLFPVVDATLKRPAQVVHELMNRKSRNIPAILTLLLLACLAGLGLMMGSFSGGAQCWAAPVKVMFGTLLSVLICMPSLFILLCLSGGEQSFPEVARILLLGLVLAGILFVGFMPVAWIFSQATESVAFMGFLYLLVWGIGLFFGLRLMKTAFRFLNKKKAGTLNLWFFIFTLVVLQMSTTLRPIIGEYEAPQFSEKKFFLVHWAETMDR